MATGTVKWFNGAKGYGFIARDDGGPDLFVHFSQIQTPDVGELYEGEAVEYETGNGSRGPQAENVVVKR